MAPMFFPPKNTKIPQIKQKSPQKKQNNSKNTKKFPIVDKTFPLFLCTKHKKAYELSPLLFLSKNLYMLSSLKEATYGQLTISLSMFN